MKTKHDGSAAADRRQEQADWLPDRCQEEDCDPPGHLQELDRLSTATERLVEAWKKYENSHQEVLGLVTEDEVEDA